MAIMVVARLHGSLAALTAQSTVWARMRPPGGALVRRLVLFADSTLDTVHTICSRPEAECVHGSHTFTIVKVRAGSCRTDGRNAGFPLWR